MNTFHKLLTCTGTYCLLSSAVLADTSEIEALKKRLAALEKHQIQKAESHSSGKFYATLRPSLTQSKQDESTTDVTDFLSHAGFYFEHDLGHGWTGIGHGEWSIDIADNGNFGKSRRAYVGFDSPYGRVAIGKQRPVQYLLIAEYVDIFNHANAPFAYDNFSPFFVNNLVSYKKQWQKISLLGSVQFNGDDGNNNEDMVNVGLSYDHNALHIAVTYLSQDLPLVNAPTSVGNTSETVALSIANSFGNGFYFASAWQQRELDLFGGGETTQTTLDISLAYQVSENNKVKAGYFDLDDDTIGENNLSYSGYNLTFEHKMSDTFQVHAEVLNKSFDMTKDETSLSVGFKYNFSMNW